MLLRRMGCGTGCGLKGASDPFSISLALLQIIQIISQLRITSTCARLWQGRSASNALVRMVDFGWGCNLPIKRWLINIRAGIRIDQLNPSLVILPPVLATMTIHCLLYRLAGLLPKYYLKEQQLGKDENKTIDIN